MSGWVRAWIGAVLIVSVAACSPVYRNHGYAPDDSQLSEILVGIDTRDSVIETIGRPSSTGVLTEGDIYYVSSRWRHFAYQEPRAVDRQLVAITFDEADVVRNIERFTLEDGQVVPLSRRVTDSNIEDISFLRQLLGGIGRFNPADLFGGDET